MGSYCSVLNDTDADMYIKFGAHALALQIAGVLVGILAIPLTGGASIGAAALGAGISVAGFVTARVDDDLRQKGYSKIRPGNTYTSEKLSLSLVCQANIVLVKRINDSKVSVKAGSITTWSAPTADDTYEYKASNATYHEEQILG